MQVNRDDISKTLIKLSKLDSTDLDRFTVEERKSIEKMGKCLEGFEFTSKIEQQELDNVITHLDRIEKNPKKAGLLKKVHQTFKNVLHSSDKVKADIDGHKFEAEYALVKDIMNNENELKKLVDTGNSYAMFYYGEQDEALKLDNPLARMSKSIDDYKASPNDVSIQTILDVLPHLPDDTMHVAYNFLRDVSLDGISNELKVSIERELKKEVSAANISEALGRIFNLPNKELDRLDENERNVISKMNYSLREFDFQPRLNRKEFEGILEHLTRIETKPGAWVSDKNRTFRNLASNSPDRMKHSISSTMHNPHIMDYHLSKRAFDAYRRNPSDEALKELQRLSQDYSYAKVYLAQILKKSQDSQRSEDSISNLLTLADLPLAAFEKKGSYYRSHPMEFKHKPNDDLNPFKLNNIPPENREEVFRFYGEMVDRGVVPLKDVANFATDMKMAGWVPTSKGPKYLYDHYNATKVSYTPSEINEEKQAEIINNLRNLSQTSVDAKYYLGKILSTQHKSQVEAKELLDAAEKEGHPLVEFFRGMPSGKVLLDQEFLAFIDKYEKLRPSLSAEYKKEGAPIFQEYWDKNEKTFPETIKGRVKDFMMSIFFDW